MSQHELFDNEVQVLIACRKQKVLFSYCLLHSMAPHITWLKDITCLLTNFLHTGFRVEHNKQLRS